MKNRFLILSCCLLMLLTTACGKSIPKTKNGEQVVASINGKEWTADELYLALKDSYGYNELMTMVDTYIGDQEIETTDDIKKYAEEVADYYEGYAKAYEMELGAFLAYFANISNIETREEFIEYVINDRKVSLAVQRQVASTLTDKEIENYYNENYSEKLTVRHILIEPEESDKDGEKALKTANEIIDKLKETDSDKVEEKFIELAKEYSDDSTYDNGGLLEGFMSSGVVSEFWDASSKLKDKEYTTTPVKTTYGYHVIYRVSRSDKPSLEDSKEEIKTALSNKMLTEDNALYSKTMNELRKKYKLSIKDSDLNTSYKEFVDSLETEEK